MKKLITREGFGILALSIVLIPQIAHTVYVFKTNSQYTDPWFAWCYAIGVDLAILIFTVKGWTKTAIIYFAGTLVTNLVYQFFPDSVYGAVLICVMLSGTIFAFSHLFYAEKPELAAEPPPIKPDTLELLKQSGIAFEVQPFQCPECQKSFATAKQLNGHISGHKQTDIWHEERYGDWEHENQLREQRLQELSLNLS